MFWSRRKSVAPQKEASPFLDKKIDELEAKLADLEDADDDMDDMDDEDDAPETPSMPQMQTPLASDMEMMHYMPSQVAIHLQTLEFSQPCSSHGVPNGRLSLSVQSTPRVKGLSKKEGAKRKMNMSGYILFSSEMRAVIKARHPDFSFGELSRLVGTEWRNLEAPKKTEYEGEEGQGDGSQTVACRELVVQTQAISFQSARLK